MLTLFRHQGSATHVQNEGIVPHAIEGMYSEHCRVWGSRVNHRAAVHVAGSLTPEREPQGCSGSGYQEWLEKILFKCIDCDIPEVRIRKETEIGLLGGQYEKVSLKL